MLFIFLLLNLAQSEELTKAATILWSYSGSDSPKRQSEVLGRLREIPCHRRIKDLECFVAEEEAHRQSHVGRLSVTEPVEVRPVDRARLRLAYRALVEAHEDLSGDPGLLALTQMNLKPDFKDALYTRLRAVLSEGSRFGRAQYYRAIPWPARTRLIEELIHQAPTDDDLSYLNRLDNMGRIMTLVYNFHSRLNSSQGLEAATNFLITTAAKNQNWDALNDFAHEQLSRNDIVLERAALEAIREIVLDPGQRRARAYYANLPFYERKQLVERILALTSEALTEPALLLELGSIDEMQDIFSHLHPRTVQAQREKDRLEEALLAKRKRQRAFANLPKPKRALLKCGQLLQKALLKIKPPTL